MKLNCLDEQERHENVEESSPSARPFPAPPTAAQSASYACRAMRGVQMPVFLRRLGLASKSRHHDSPPKGHIHESGLRGSSCVSRPSSCYSSTATWTCCQSTLLQTSHPKLVLTRHPKTTSCQHKLVTTHQLLVECPCSPYQTPKSLTSAHEVMNQLYMPNPHSVIVNNVEMCRSTQPQQCLNPCLLDRVQVFKPQIEHKTTSVW